MIFWIPPRASRTGNLEEKHLVFGCIILVIAYVTILAVGLWLQTK